MSDVRYGVIGTGMMGVEHINNLRHLDGATVTAIADVDERSRTLGVAAAGASVATFADHRDLLDSGLVDAVVVATPNMTHGAVLLDVLATDLHVLAEKPLCATVKQCRAVVAAAAARPAGIAWMGLEYRYKPPIARLIDEVRKGTAGPPRMVAIREHRFPFLVKVGNWNRFNRNTGGTLVEKACHFFDLMTLLAGSPPVRVMASGAQDVNHLDESYDGEAPDVLDNAFVIVDHENGVRAMLDLCMFADGSEWEQELSVVGTAGKVEAFVPPHGDGAVKISPRYGTPSTEPVGDARIGYQGLHSGASYLEHVDFLEAIRAGTPPAVTLEDGLLAVAVGVAAHTSVAEGRMVPMSEVL